MGPTIRPDTLLGREEVGWSRSEQLAHQLSALVKAPFLGGTHFMSASSASICSSIRGSVTARGIRGRSRYGELFISGPVIGFSGRDPADSAGAGSRKRLTGRRELLSSREVLYPLHSRLRGRRQQYRLFRGRFPPVNFVAFSAPETSWRGVRPRASNRCRFTTARPVEVALPFPAPRVSPQIWPLYCPLETEFAQDRVCC
jgi:hypothetical protein